MKSINETPEPPEPVADINAADLANASLANAIVTAVNASHGPRKIKPTEYMKTRSVHRNKPQLTRKIYQNGFMLSREQLTAQEIEMLNKIKPGVYAQGVLRVVSMQDGDDRSRPPSLDLVYQNKSMDERMNLKAQFRDFEAMLSVILAEMGEAS